MRHAAVASDGQLDGRSVAVLGSGTSRAQSDCLWGSPPFIVLSQRINLARVVAAEKDRRATEVEQTGGTCRR